MSERATTLVAFGSVLPDVFMTYQIATVGDTRSVVTFQLDKRVLRDWDLVSPLEIRVISAEYVQPEDAAVLAAEMQRVAARMTKELREQLQP